MQHPTVTVIGDRFIAPLNSAASSGQNFILCNGLREYKQQSVRREIWRRKLNRVYVGVYFLLTWCVEYSLEHKTTATTTTAAVKTWCKSNKQLKKLQ